MPNKLQPFGNPSQPLNPLSLAIAMDCSFVARAFAGGDGLPHLKELMKMAIRHKGFAMIDILQNCISFNRINTFHWYKDRTYFLENEHDPADRLAAFQRSLEWGEKIPLGIFYRNQRPTMADKIPVLKENPLVKQSFDHKEVIQKESGRFY